MPRRRHHFPLRVLLNNRLVGHLNKAASGAIDFRYEQSWLDWDHALPVSLSLPLREETYIVDGSSEHLLSKLASSVIDVAFVAEDHPRWDNKMLSVWSERVVVAVPADHPLSAHETVRWYELRNEQLLVPYRGPGPEFLKLLAVKTGCPNFCQVVRHDTGLDRLLTLVGAGGGILLALEGATGATFPGVTFREVHDDGGPTRLGFCACWRQSNSNPSLRSFLNMLRERYPDLSDVGAAD